MSQIACQLADMCRGSIDGSHAGAKLRKASANSLMLVMIVSAPAMTINGHMMLDAQRQALKGLDGPLVEE